MSTVFKMNTGDLQPSLQATLLTSDGTPANLVGATVIFTMTQRSVVLVRNPAVIVNAANGIVRYDWQLGNTNYYGSCKGVFTVIYPTGSTQTFPVSSDLNIVFPQQYPEFTSIDEVVDHLNATGPDSQNKFTVYGLPISADAVQAQVNHANKYLFSLVPSLQISTDPRWVSAELAATDLACLGILVTSIGGALVGTYDYSLGDMRVARAGPYASAIEKAIAGYRQSAKQELQNVTSAVASAKVKLGDRVPQKGCLGSYGWSLG